MKILLVGINAKYIHTNLAIRYLYACAKKEGITTVISEYTINQQKDKILASIYAQKPDIIGFSCYIWNIELTKQLISDIKKVMDVKIIAGGPEASKNLGADFVVKGEGEGAFLEIIKGEKRKFSFSETVFPYEAFSELNSRIIYYETQRGCPYKCAYCLSSIGSGLQFLPIDRIYKELEIFLKNNVRQVKFVDRTFNCNKEHSRKIWRFLSENDNGYSNFHFEICADLLEDQDFEILKSVRRGYFQFEIGVQSTNLQTLAEIDRLSRYSKIAENVRYLSNNKNIHLHLDLIAGLPHESYETFKKSFSDVYSLSPDVMQLGFLKVLKDSKIYKNAEKYGILYSETAPYTVLQTKDLSFGDISRLKNVEHMLDSFYNSHLARNTVRYFQTFFKSSFDLYEGLGDFWEENGFNLIEHSKIKMFERLLVFFETRISKDGEKWEIAKDALLYDILINDNLKTLPVKLNKEKTQEQEGFVAAFLKDRETIGNIEPKLLVYDYRQLKKRCNIAFFDYDVKNGFAKRKNTVFFIYENGHRGVSI